MNSLCILIIVILLVNAVTSQYPPSTDGRILQDPASSFFSALFGRQRRGPPTPVYNGGFPVDDYFEPNMMVPPFPSRYNAGPQFGNSMGGGFGPDSLAYANLLSYANDKDNFQPQGCGFDLTRNRCTDGLNICKGGCRDFAIDPAAHECKCVPFTLMALLGFGK
ncbi:hypothetical protein M3Y94_00209000 [Aphelenchoides besseyi]|nr:hypothetical protein M3Y94_00209000 [Aphelenchoides besseyi]KAI6236641.1 hypothetical protein M3Y95_00179200 [Aphelenchoides besseyi]